MLSRRRGLLRTFLLPVVGDALPRRYLLARVSGERFHRCRPATTVRQLQGVCRVPFAPRQIPGVSSATRKLLLSWQKIDR